MLTGVVLVVGGTRSGKSAFAESLVADDADVVYLATASAADAEMAERIGAHRRRRPASWRTIEVGADAVHALGEAGEATVLLDGLGGWIAGVLHRAGAFDDPARLDAAVADVRARVADLADRAATRGARTVIVVEEAGAAPVAVHAATRAWVDLVGEAAQRLGAVADRAVHVVAGRVVELPAASPVAPGPAVAARPLHGDRMVAEDEEDFAVNVVGGGPPPWLAAALHDALGTAAGRYPDARRAHAALARRHGRPDAEVLTLNGAAEGFWLLAAALSPRRPVVLAPAFTEAATALRAHGRRAEHVDRLEADGFALRPEAVPAGADLVVLANPCNPTGALHDPDVVASLARPGRTLVVDEAFMDLVPGEPSSVAGRSGLPGLVVLRSLTKSLGIPGLRAGYLLAAADLVARLDALRQPWPVNALALAALTAWARRGADDEVARRVAAAREDLERRLAALPGVTVRPGAANFLLVRVPDGPRVVAALRARRLAVRPTQDLGLDDGCLRVAVRDPAAHERLAGALAEVLG